MPQARPAAESTTPSSLAGLARDHSVPLDAWLRRVRRSRTPAAPQARARTAQRRPACLAAHQPVGVQDVEGVQEAVRDAAQHPSPLAAVGSMRGLDRARRSGAATVLVLAHLDGIAGVPGAPGGPFAAARAAAVGTSGRSSQSTPSCVKHTRRSPCTRPSSTAARVLPWATR